MMAKNVQVQNDAKWFTMTGNIYVNTYIHILIFMYIVDVLYTYIDLHFAVISVVCINISQKDTHRWKKISESFFFHTKR